MDSIYHSSPPSFVLLSYLLLPHTLWFQSYNVIVFTFIVLECPRVLESHSLGFWTKLQGASQTPLLWDLDSNTDSPRLSVFCRPSLPLSWPSQNVQMHQIVGLLLRVTFFQRISALFSVIVLFTLSCLQTGSCFSGCFQGLQLPIIQFAIVES